MAAYAALVSLMNTMDQIQNHPRLSISLDKKQTESLGEKVGFLLDFVESYSHGGSEEEQVLESQIASVAHAAEDVIEIHVVDQIHAGSISLLDLQKLVEDMDAVKENVVSAKEERRFKYPSPATSSSTLVTCTGKSEDILSLSYIHLPVHLKPCFLYMGIFEQDREIRLSRLIKLWVAEGFLKPKEDESLEKVAESYLKDLVDRNLILVHKWGVNRKIKSCKMHALVRDLCLREAKKEKFFCVMGAPQDLETEHRVVCYGDYLNTYDPQSFNTLSSKPLARSLVWERVPVLFKCRLLRVLEGVAAYSVKDIFKHVNLRYLAYTFGWHPLYDHISLLKYHLNLICDLPSSISLLWNVQTLIVTHFGGQITAPPELWEMTQLRHVEFHELCLPEPPPSDQQDDDFVLRNLQTLSKVVNFRLSDEVCKRIPNIKKLKIKYDDFSASSSDYYCLYNLGRLHKLESLYCSFERKPNRPGDLLQNLTFPSSLHKLILEDCCLHWEDLAMIGSLPHLEVLKLRQISLPGNEWNPVEGEFLGLKYLEINLCSDLRYWNANSSHFPVLENLLLVLLSELDEIPAAIGEIQTLRSIDVLLCSESAAISSMKILEEQLSLGNEDFRVTVMFWKNEELEEFREKVKEEFGSFTSNNLQLFYQNQVLQLLGLDLTQDECG